jgi:hypothetical protein
MIQLYQGSGASDFVVLGDNISSEQMLVLFKNADRLLRARGQSKAADILARVPFRVVEATNDFGDEFSMLLALVSLDQYEHFRLGQDDASQRQAFRQIANVISEIGQHIRFISAELTLEPAISAGDQAKRALKRSEINKLVHKYIGVSGGYLGDFSYRSHHEFYIDLDLDINPYDYNGTTRERFIKILKESSPNVQARILEGILNKYPTGTSDLRTQALRDQIREWIARLRGVAQVDHPSLRVTSEIVERALRDTQELLRATGAPSGVDRVHTALHGYLKALCLDGGVPLVDDSSLPELFKKLRDDHPAFQDLGPRAGDIIRVLRSLGAILDTLNPLRNKASVAHPNPKLLPEPEAMLVINSVRTILHYLDEKVHTFRTGRR